MFQAPCSSGGWGGRWIGVGVVGVPPTHMHTHAHAHTHACMVNTIISCKWLPPFGESMAIPYDGIHMCMCMHVCACVCVWGAPPHHPPPPYTHPPPLTTLHPHTPIPHPLTTLHSHTPIPPPPRGEPRNQWKFNSTSVWRCEICGDFPTQGWMYSLVGGWVGRWVGWWVGLGQITTNLKIVDWIKIIQFCLKIYHL